MWYTADHVRLQFPSGKRNNIKERRCSSIKRFITSKSEHTDLSFLLLAIHQKFGIVYEISCCG